MSTPTFDLTRQPPRSPRVRLGGYVLLPRMLDKSRAALAGTNGECQYDCPLDKRFLEFAGIDAKALKKQIATGKGDGEILAWVRKNAKAQRTEPEIEAWSAWQERRVHDNPDSREYFNGLHKKVRPRAHGHHLMVRPAGCGRLRNLRRQVVTCGQGTGFVARRP